MGAVPPLFYGLTVSFLTMNRNPSLKKSKFRLLIQQLSADTSLFRSFRVKESRSAEPEGKKAGDFCTTCIFRASPAILRG